MADVDVVSVTTLQPKICFVKQNEEGSSGVSFFRVTIQPMTLVSPSVECPVTWCRKKIKKNCSLGEHIRSHLTSIFQELSKDSPAPTCKDSFEVKYLCPDSTCKHSEERNLGSFDKLKYLKQHFLKVHAPKNFECPTCNRTFALESYLRRHKAMCGKSFFCSCKMSYNTLEALQTHARRKQHNYDVSKYRQILSAERGRITVGAENFASTDTSKNRPISPVKQCQLFKYPLLYPKTNSSNAFDILRFQDASTQFGIVISDVTPTKTVVDFGTQTVPSLGNHAHSSTTAISISPYTVRTPTAEASDVRPSKRKKTAETQTARFKVRVSTETQTTNVVKRRRSTRKKQSAEAETQCQPAVCNVNAAPPVIIPKSTRSSCVGTTTTTEPDPINFEEDSLFKDLEVHIQTQTDPDLLLGTGAVFGDYDVHVNMNDPEVTSFLNFVTTETQTGHPATSSSWSSNFLDCSIPETADMSTIMHDDISGASLQPLSSSYLETMDSETQTPFGDFQSMFPDMFHF